MPNAFQLFPSCFCCFSQSRKDYFHIAPLSLLKKLFEYLDHHCMDVLPDIMINPRERDDLFPSSWNVAELPTCKFSFFPLIEFAEDTTKCRELSASWRTKNTFDCLAAGCFAFFGAILWVNWSKNKERETDHQLLTPQWIMQMIQVTRNFNLMRSTRKTVLTASRSFSFWITNHPVCFASGPRKNREMRANRTFPCLLQRSSSTTSYIFR